MFRSLTFHQGAVGRVTYVTGETAGAVEAQEDCLLPEILRPIARWRRFKIRWQASTPGYSTGRAEDTRYQRLYSHTSSTLTQQFSARCSIYGKASTREDKSSNWLHSASPPIKTIIWWCFAAGVDAVMFRSENIKANKRRGTV